MSIFIAFLGGLMVKWYITMNAERLLMHYGTVSAVPVLQELLRMTQQSFHQGQILWRQLVKKNPVFRSRNHAIVRDLTALPQMGGFQLVKWIDRSVMESTDVKKSQRSERIRFQQRQPPCSDNTGSMGMYRDQHVQNQKNTFKTWKNHSLDKRSYMCFVEFMTELEF